MLEFLFYSSGKPMIRKKLVKVQEGWIGPRKRDETIQSLLPSEGALQIDLTKKGNFEWWYIDAQLENGYTTIVFFHARNHLTNRTEIEVIVYSPLEESKDLFFPFKLRTLNLLRKKQTSSLVRIIFALIF